MRPLRWKSRYLTGDEATDTSNRELVDCLNKLVNAARLNEHCHDVEEVIDDIADEADRRLLEREEGGELAEGIRAELMTKLPLPAYGTNACRKCGVCDMAAHKVAERFQDAALCLHLDEAGQIKEEPPAAATPNLS